MPEITSVQWFPGHMAKTRRLIKESLPMIDAVAEIIDARIPLSSRNPELDQLITNKPRLIILNKSDIADMNITKAWIDYFKSQGHFALPADCKSGSGLRGFLPLAKQVLAEKLERLAKKGMSGRTIKIMVVGIPNVGKSSFINRMAGAAKTKVEDRPGVTRGQQWITLQGGADLLDTPGVLWPKFDDPEVGEKLAFTGAVKDDVMDTEQLAERLLELLIKKYPQYLFSRYGLEQQKQTGHQMLEQIAKRRGFLISGGQMDIERSAIIFLDEFRSGQLGRISLETPEPK